MIKILYLIIFLSLSFVSCKHALHMFQQNRYEFYRYTKWLFNKKNIHFSIYLIYVLLMILVTIFFRGKREVLLVLGISVIMAIYLAYKESKKEYIKDLVLTNRVKRQIVYLVILLVLILFITLSNIHDNIGIAGILALYLPYLLIYPMALLTLPLENIIKKRYENEARDILKHDNNLIKIGITGSFGKTTTKNLIKDILNNNFYTLMTPASYNTPMGITRTIREELKPIHEVFVCEMGADHVGDITYLMDFVKPKYGVLSAIGPQHLNTFKNIGNIINEKVQVIEMLPEDGVGFINLDNGYIKEYEFKNKCKIVSVGVDNEDADLVARNIKYSNDGTSFDLYLDDDILHFSTPLLGKHNITNILLGIALALELNMSKEDILNSVKNVNQVEHRLQLRKINNFNFIDNAFNSNPVSSKLSLEVLSKMPGKRIIVTPGLIDLGDKEDEYNYNFGTYMLNNCDFVILVGEKQTNAIYNGLKDSGFDMNNVLVVSKVKEAFDYIYTNFSSEDTILLENDLPDAFNI